MAIIVIQVTEHVLVGFSHTKKDLSRTCVNTKITEANLEEETLVVEWHQGKSRLDLYNMLNFPVIAQHHKSNVGVMNIIIPTQEDGNLVGLSERQAKQFIFNFFQNQPEFNNKELNCATLLYKILQAAGAKEKYGAVKIPQHSTLFFNKIMVRDVLAYSYNLAETIYKAANGLKNIKLGMSMPTLLSSNQYQRPLPNESMVMMLPFQDKENYAYLYPLRVVLPQQIVNAKMVQQRENKLIWDIILALNLSGNSELQKIKRNYEQTLKYYRSASLQPARTVGDLPYHVATLMAFCAFWSYTNPVILNHPVIKLIIFAVMALNIYNLVINRFSLDTEYPTIDTIDNYRAEAPVHQHAVSIGTKRYNFEAEVYQQYNLELLKKIDEISKKSQNIETKKINGLLEAAEGNIFPYVFSFEFYVFLNKCLQMQGVYGETAINSITNPPPMLPATNKANKQEVADLENLGLETLFKVNQH